MGIGKLLGQEKTGLIELTEGGAVRTGREL